MSIVRCEFSTPGRCFRTPAARTALSCSSSSRILLLTAAIIGVALSASTVRASQRSEVLYSKGLVRFHARDYTGSRELFEAAVKADPQDAHALYYRAMALGRLNEDAAAVEDLQRAIALDPSMDQALVELAFLQTRLNRHDDAEKTLTIARTRPAIADQAEVLWLNTDRTAAAAQRSGRRYRLSARLGTEYDSNVPLAPENDALRAQLLDGVSEADGRAILDATGVVSLYASELVRVSARYDFEQSLHFDLDEFDIQTHRGSIDVGSNAGPVQYGLRGSYAYTSNDGDDLVLEGTVLPWLRVLEGDWGNLDVYYRLRSRDFLEEPFDDLVTGLNHAAGIRQFFYLGRIDRYLMVGYRFDVEEPDHAAGSALGYDGHQAETGIGWALTDWLSAQAIYAYRHESYHYPSTGREDDEHAVWLRSEAALCDWASLIAGYRLRINDSNKIAFEYDGQIATLAVELSY